MGKKFNDTLKYLGNSYSSAIIDLEEVIYRKINDFEIEISGLNSYGRYNVTLYLWKDRQIVKTIPDIHSKEELAKHLDIVVSECSLNQD